MPVTTTYTLSGVTRNSRGAALPACTVEVFDTATLTSLGSAVSDSDANYVVTLSSNTGACFAVAYLSGSPDVAGTTLNNLVPTSTSVGNNGLDDYYYIYGY